MERIEMSSEKTTTKPVHPWRQMVDAKAKLKADRAKYYRRRSLEYRNENIEHARATERLWHRKKSGKMPLEAPVMTKHDSGAMGAAIRKGRRTMEQPK